MLNTGARNLRNDGNAELRLWQPDIAMRLIYRVNIDSVMAEGSGGKILYHFVTTSPDKV